VHVKLIGLRARTSKTLRGAGSEPSMSLFDHPRWLFLAVFGGLILVTEAGCWLARRTDINADETYHEQISGIRDSLFVLLSLLIGFTFSMALDRYDQRRQTAIDEANAIGTTLLRARLLAEPENGRATELLKQYVGLRMAFFNAHLESPEMAEIETGSKRIQNQLWDLTASGAQRDRTVIMGAFVQTLNEMIDLDAKRLAARENRIPLVIWVLISMIALFATFLTGLSLKKRFWVSLVLLPAMLAVSIALVADLDAPTHGFILVDHRPMERLQQDISR
jgi:hypothetical protein